MNTGQTVINHLESGGEFWEGESRWLRFHEVADVTPTKMFLGSGKKLENTEETHMDIGKTPHQK